MRVLAGAALVALLASSGCRLASRPTVPIETGVNFAAHREHARIVIDRLPDGAGGVVEPPGWFRWGGAPTFVLTRDGQTTAGLWLTAPATVQVRSARSPTAPIVAAVDPSWDDNAIWLTLRPADGAPLRTSTFERTVTGGGPPVLSRIAQTSIDVRGTYRAVVRNAQGGEVGWLRVKISPYQESPRIYDGVLPSDVAPGAAAAIAVALCSEIDWIETHTLDVNRGTGTTGPLQQSVPMGR